MTELDISSEHLREVLELLKEAVFPNATNAEWRAGTIEISNGAIKITCAGKTKVSTLQGFTEL